MGPSFVVTKKNMANYIAGLQCPSCKYSTTLEMILEVSSDGILRASLLCRQCSECLSGLTVVGKEKFSNHPAGSKHYEELFDTLYELLDRRVSYKRSKLIEEITSDLALYEETSNLASTYILTYKLM